jgi:hypothetical protein
MPYCHFPSQEYPCRSSLCDDSENRNSSREARPKPLDDISDPRDSSWPTPGLAHRNSSSGMPEDSDLAEIGVEFRMASSISFSFSWTAVSTIMSIHEL